MHTYCYQENEMSKNNDYARTQFLKKAAQEYAKLRKKPDFLQEEKQEQELWDVTLSDGLEDFKIY